MTTILRKISAIFSVIYIKMSSLDTVKFVKYLTRVTKIYIINAL